MRTYLFEATQSIDGAGNWGKFMVGVMDVEWEWHSKISDHPSPLLRQRGWTPRHIWVLDLQTGEGACFRHGGHASADLNNHAIWVCPLYEPFLAWLYTQDLANLDELSASVVQLPDAPFAIFGYRRPGPAPATNVAE